MNTATYCPEDNKLRLYVGRVPRDEYLKLRAEGWTATPKQDCNFVAVWTPERRDTALEYAEIIEDEDQSPEERAADRAERFGEYRDKRTEEATGHADRFDAGSAVHGYQDANRGARAARRHDRIADHAVDAWSKAEYWISRTAGVISHALYKSTPGVRMGRIKVLEAELRAKVERYEKAAKLFDVLSDIRAITDLEKRDKMVLEFFGHVSMHREYPHPDHPEEVHSIYVHLTSEQRRHITSEEALAMYFSDHSRPDIENNDWANHYKLRLTYENQMLEAQGGRAAFVEMVPSGWIGGHQIRKVNKSNATGRVVSVTLKMPGDRWGNTREGFHMMVYNIERLPAGAYRAPTPEDLESLKETKTAEKSAQPAKAPCPLINPTDQDAERLQTAWNEEIKTKWDAKRAKAENYDYVPEYEPQTVCRITQAQYSTNSKGTYAKAETANLVGNAKIRDEHRGAFGADYRQKIRLQGPVICKVRTTNGKVYMADRVIVITDKPQKPFPAALWQSPVVTSLETVEV